MGQLGQVTVIPVGTAKTRGEKVEKKRLSIASKNISNMAIS